jgi:hypothetical protein
VGIQASEYKLGHRCWNLAIKVYTIATCVLLPSPSPGCKQRPLLASQDTLCLMQDLAQNRGHCINKCIYISKLIGAEDVAQW